MASYRNHIAIMLILISFIALSGCEETNTERRSAFIGGSDGLNIEFIKNAPPEEIFDEEYPFSISLKVENVGEWDIESESDTTVKISGIDPADFGKSHGDLTADSDTELNGAYRDPDGDEVRGTLTNFEFSNLQYEGEVASAVDLPIRAEVCYRYGTNVNSKICVLEDLLGKESRDEKEDICDPNGAKPSENSGAPVHIKNFKQTAVSSDKLSFSFTISHVGDGAVSRRGTECSDTVGEKDRVYVEVDTGISGLKCSGLEGGADKGETTLYDGEREIVCTQPLPSDRGNYEKQIEITLEYDYEDHVDTTITVKPSS